MDDLLLNRPAGRLRGIRPDPFFGKNFKVMSTRSGFDHSFHVVELERDGLLLIGRAAPGKQPLFDRKEFFNADFPNPCA
ncbi:MAG: hypothetical protein HQL83_17390 [Magnetococcales bacterium]|nr:hypothetical protein [Magnetococcales bacterium]